MDSCSRSSIEFAQPDTTAEIAYMIENNAIIGFLSNRIKASCPNVTVRTKAKVVDCRYDVGKKIFSQRQTDFKYHENTNITNYIFTLQSYFAGLHLIWTNLLQLYWMMEPSCKRLLLLAFTKFFKIY